jgi:hypothetical protein
MANMPLSGEPARLAELREALDLASVRWDQATPGPVTGPELFLVSPDIPVWRRWLTMCARERMFIVAVVAAVAAIASVVVALVG